MSLYQVHLVGNTDQQLETDAEKNIASFDTLENASRDWSDDQDGLEVVELYKSDRLRLVRRVPKNETALANRSLRRR